MKKAIFTLFLALCAVSSVRAQATIAISASHIQGVSGASLASGSICWQGTDQNNQILAFQKSGGGAVVTTPFCTAVTSGAITTFSVPNPANTTPTNIRYRVTITQGARTIATMTGVYLCATSGSCTTPYTFNFDNCFSLGACNAAPIPIVSGPGGPAGPTGPAGPLAAGCEIVIGDPGSGSPALSNDNASPSVCANLTGADLKISAVACWANAGSPTITPILTGGTSTSILSGALPCGTASWAAGSVNGTPTIHTFASNGATCATPPCTIDMNITTAGGTAKYIVVHIIRAP